jgi:hypothetical protein
MLVAGAWFAYENQQLIQPLLFGYELPERSTGMYLFVVFTLRIIGGYLLSAVLSQWSKIKSSTKLHQKNKEIKRLKGKVESAMKPSKGLKNLDLPDIKSSTENISV